MYKKYVFFSSVLLIFLAVLAGLQSRLQDNYSWFAKPVCHKYTLQYPAKNKHQYKQSTVPFAGKNFVGYKEAVGYRESRGSYTRVNSYGYMGKYQFGASALRAVGIHNKSAFLSNPALQEEAFVALLSRNKWELRDEIRKYAGKTIGGVYITESGILAAAHLGGAGSVKRFFRSNGAHQSRDGYGTSIKSYLEHFSGYQTEFIKANAKAKVIM